MPWNSQPCFPDKNWRTFTILFLPMMMIMLRLSDVIRERYALMLQWGSFLDGHPCFDR